MTPWAHEFLRSNITTGHYRTLTTQDAFRKALSLDPQKSDWLVLEVLSSCHCAATAAMRPDPFRKKRQRAIEYLKVRPMMRKAVKTLRRKLASFPEESSWDLWRANLILKKHTDETRKSDFPVHASATWVEIMAALEEALDRPSFGLNTGPMMHRFYAGPLIYPEGLDHQRKQPQEALNGLIFSLAFHFRRATAGKQGEPWQASSEMPKGGAPQIPLIVAFAKATFPLVEISPSIVRDRLKELTLKRVGLTLWPK